MKLIKRINIVFCLLLTCSYAIPLSALNSDYTESHFWATRKSPDSVLLERMNSRQFDIDKISILKSFLNSSTDKLRFDTFLTIIRHLDFESSKLDTARLFATHIEKPSNRQQCAMLRSFASHITQREVFKIIGLNERKVMETCNK
ncbi:hypothetical protein EOPP23_16905 [Endozoicomonas sp. OPT23]|uniref:hypothetical protein n=1 Tax=Endozoicomonas sp. OPT23 TaxID=2072845 RepID=UPI00129A5C75|nr:hypothetical protein [Endozoicomonas sp. OPT23]MRI34665.1 hypothetical protein [Endozoicomonas sp. OPT23]